MSAKAPHKPVLLRPQAYALAKSIAVNEDRSMSDVVSEAIEEYRSSRKLMYRYFEEFLRFIKQKEVESHTSNPTLQNG